MAITLRSTATTNSGSSTTPSVALPTSGATGDLLVVAIGHNDGTVTIADNNSGNTISSTNITTGAISTPGTSFTTNSFTPKANKLYLISMAVRNNDNSTDPLDPTITGCGLTWVNVNGTIYDNTGTSRRRITVFRALGSSPSTGTLTIDFGAVTHNNLDYSIDEFYGVDISGTNGSGAIVQSAVNQDTAGTASTLTATLGAFGSTNNATFGVFAGNNLTVTTTAGTGFAKVGDIGGNSRLTTEFRQDNDTSVDITFSTTCQIGGVAIELKAAATPMTEDYDSGNDAGGTGVGWYTRVITGSEPATLNFTISTTNRWAITAFIITGQNATIYDVAISTYDMRLATTTHTCAGCTTNTDNAWAIAFDNLDSGTNTFSAGPGGSWTQIATVNTQQPIAVYYLEKTTAGATGNASFTSTNSGNSLAMRQFAIKAATVAATSTYSTLLMMGV